MQLSIIIPAKNEVTNLRPFLEALQRQKEVEFEVILADAQSTDGTQKLAESFGVRVVEGGLPGPGRNAGARVARGEWICFHDADVLPLSETYYKEALRALEAQGADVGTTRFIPSAGGWKNVLFHWLYHVYVWCSESFVPHAGGGCIFVRRAWHERVKGFDETVVFAEDMEYVQRLIRTGATFTYLSHIPLQASVRRLERDGYFRTAWRYGRAEWYMRWHGPIRHELFPYGFTYPKKSA